MDASARIAVQKFCDVWKGSLTSLIGSLGAASPAFDWTVPLAGVADPAASSPVTKEDNTIDSWFTAKGGLQGVVGWRCRKNVAVQLAQLLQSELLDPAVEFSELHRDAFAEFFRQVAGLAATGWNDETGNAVELVHTTGATPQPSTAQTASLQIKSEKFAELTLQIFVDAVLCSALNAAPVEPAAPQLAASATDSLASQLSDGPIPNLALLLDVELEATIRFGQRDMLLREVFGLMPGAVIELNQLVNEPAELLVAGRLIARGEVVVVDGNFGLRVTEVATAGQRAALLEL